VSAEETHMRTHLHTLGQLSAPMLLVAMAITMVGPHASVARADGYSVNRENTGLRFTDASNGRTLISPNGFSIVSDTQARTTITISNQPGGFDLVVTYTNPGSTPLPLGQINIGGIRFGQVIGSRDFAHDSKLVTYDHQNQTRTFTSREYPADAYSPVLVISEGDYTIGASLNYPIAEYNHKIDIFFQSPMRTPNDNGRNWMLSFRLYDSLPAGQTRTYTVPVRVAKGNQHWLETLKPYREYFTSLYGGVQYTRDPRPVRGFHLSYTEFLSSTSQRGFYNANLDPSINGYGPWANYIRTNSVANGFNRVMIWAPTGVYYTRRDDNFPCMFMTGGDSIPMLRNSQNLLRSIADAGIDVGYWWGYAQFVSPGGWDTGHTMINVDNAAHLALAWREMDRAVSIGATTVGLDAFTLMDPAPALRYLRMLRERYPTVKFISEVSLADIFHVYAGTFVFGSQITSPNYLADFLVPGQETWYLCGYETARPGETEAQVRLREMRRAAEMGYVPLINTNIPITSDMLAAEGWNALPDSVRPIVGGGNTSNTNNSMASGLSGFLTRTNGNRPDGGGGGSGNITQRNNKSGNAETIDHAGSKDNPFDIGGLTSKSNAKTTQPGDPSNTPPAKTDANGLVIDKNLATGTEEALKAAAASKELSTLSGEVTNALANNAASTTRPGTSRTNQHVSPRTTVPPPASLSRGPSRVMKQSTAQVEYTPPGANGSPIPTIFTLRSPYIDAIKNVFPDSSKANAALRRAASPAETQTAEATEK